MELRRFLPDVAEPVSCLSAVFVALHALYSFASVRYNPEIHTLLFPAAVFLNYSWAAIMHASSSGDSKRVDAETIRFVLLPFAAILNPLAPRYATASMLALCGTWLSRSYHHNVANVYMTEIVATAFILLGTKAMCPKGGNAGILFGIILCIVATAFQLLSTVEEPWPIVVTVEPHAVWHILVYVGLRVISDNIGGTTYRITPVRGYPCQILLGLVNTRIFGVSCHVLAWGLTLPCMKRLSLWPR